MATRVKVQQYDNGIKLYINIRKDNFIEPLDGATVTLKFKSMEDATLSPMIRNCTIVDAEMGECLYTLTSADTTHPGGYGSEVETVYKNGTKLSEDNPIILIITEETIR